MDHTSQLDESSAGQTGTKRFSNILKIVSRNFKVLSHFKTLRNVFQSVHNRKNTESNQNKHLQFCRKLYIVENDYLREKQKYKIANI